MIRRGFVDTSFGQIHYREIGSGTPLVLLHQTPDSSECYLAAMPCLAEHFRAIAMDTPGFGESAHPADPPGIAGYARAVLELLDGLGIERTMLMGHHTGASIAVEVAAAAPDRVIKLVLQGCPDYEPADRAEKFAAAKPTPIEADGSHISRTWQAMSGRFGSEPWATPAAIQRTVIDSVKAGPLWYYAYQAVFSQDVRSRIPSITAPTLLMGSANDPLVARQDALRPLFADARTTVLDTVAALTMIENPALFCDTVTAFLLS